MQKSVDHLKDHYIVCGFGRVGGEVVDNLRQKQKPYVVVEVEAEILATSDLLHIIGDAADDDILRKAGVGRAAGLVAVTGSDATNLFITISAHTLNPDLNIVARANHPTTDAKLLRAGATNVISPYTLGGRRIATQLLYPSVADFLDVVMHSGDLELWLEEIEVKDDSDLHGKTVAEGEVRRRTGANVLALVRHDGTENSVVRNPPSTLRLHPGDVLIALGTKDQLQALETLTKN